MHVQYSHTHTHTQTCMWWQKKWGRKCLCVCVWLCTCECCSMCTWGIHIKSVCVWVPLHWCKIHLYSLILSNTCVYDLHTVSVPAFRFSTHNRHRRHRHHTIIINIFIGRHAFYVPLYVCTHPFRSQQKNFSLISANEHSMSVDELSNSFR